MDTEHTDTASVPMPPTFKLHSFDYNAVEATVASDLRAQAVRIKQRIAKTTGDFIDIGRDHPLPLIYVPPESRAR